MKRKHRLTDALTKDQKAQLKAFDEATKAPINEDNYKRVRILSEGICLSLLKILEEEEQRSTGASKTIRTIKRRFDRIRNKSTD